MTSLVLNAYARFPTDFNFRCFGGVLNTKNSYSIRDSGMTVYQICSPFFFFFKQDTWFVGALLGTDLMPARVGNGQNAQIMGQTQKSESIHS